MIATIVLLHRWLGIAFALLFAMWFATGMVMHFVPFPSLTEAERVAGLSPIDSRHGLIGPQDAVEASGIADVIRVRLIQRPDGPVFVVSSPSRVTSIRASDGANATIATSDQARALADRHARNRGFAGDAAIHVALADYDQWSVPNGFDRYRPLFRVVLGDVAGTELYVASTTGEIVLQTRRRERVLNFVGSVVHWIYPTILRRDWALWDRVVWTLSLFAAIAAMLGAVLGLARVKIRNGRLGSPYRGWHALHHIIGMVATMFVLTWIVSGWLSMDHGRLFSRGEMTASEAAIISPPPDWRRLSSEGWPPPSPSAREVEWFAFDGHIDRRDRVALDRQMLLRAGNAGSSQSDILNEDDIRAMTVRLGAGCGAPSIVPSDDAYAIHSAVQGAPVYRTICGDLWFDIDSASGAVVQRLDASRRAYRWAYSALHTLDFPILLRHPDIRTILVVSLCGLGLLFSITGIVIGWRRLRLSV